MKIDRKFGDRGAADERRVRDIEAQHLPGPCEEGGFEIGLVGERRLKFAFDRELLIEEVGGGSGTEHVVRLYVLVDAELGGLDVDSGFGDETGLARGDIESDVLWEEAVLAREAWAETSSSSLLSDAACRAIDEFVSLVRKIETHEHAVSKQVVLSRKWIVDIQ